MAVVVTVRVCVYRYLPLIDYVPHCVELYVCFFVVAFPCLMMPSLSRTCAPEPCFYIYTLLLPSTEILWCFRIVYVRCSQAYHLSFLPTVKQDLGVNVSTLYVLCSGAGYFRRDRRQHPR